MMIKKMMTMIMAKMVMIGSRIMKRTAKARTTTKSTIAVITVTSGLDTQTRLMGHFPLY